MKRFANGVVLVLAFAVSYSIAAAFDGCTEQEANYQRTDAEFWMDQAVFAQHDGNSAIDALDYGIQEAKDRLEEMSSCMPEDEIDNTEAFILAAERHSDDAKEDRNASLEHSENAFDEFQLGDMDLGNSLWSQACDHYNESDVWSISAINFIETVGGTLDDCFDGTADVDSAHYIMDSYEPCDPPMP